MKVVLEGTSKMNRKKIFLFIVVIIIPILLISTATAIPNINSKPIMNSINEKEKIDNILSAINEKLSILFDKKLDFSNGINNILDSIISLIWEIIKIILKVINFSLGVIYL